MSGAAIVRVSRTKKGELSYEYPAREASEAVGSVAGVGLMNTGKKMTPLYDWYRGAFAAGREVVYRKELPR